MARDVPNGTKLRRELYEERKARNRDVDVIDDQALLIRAVVKQLAGFGVKLGRDELRRLLAREKAALQHLERRVDAAAQARRDAVDDERPTETAPA